MRPTRRRDGKPVESHLDKCFLHSRTDVPEVHTLAVIVHRKCSRTHGLYCDNNMLS